MQFKSIILVFILLSLGVQLKAQGIKARLDSARQAKADAITKNLMLSGTVLKDDFPLENAIVTAKINDRIARSSDTTDANGRFSIPLDFGYTYIVSFSKEGLVTKKVEVNTSDIPEEDRNIGYETAGFKVGLFTRLPDFDFSLYHQPVGRIAYDVAYKQFTYDRKFIKQKAKQTQALELQIAEELKNFEEEEAKKFAQYDIFIRDADIEFSARDFALAKEFYEEALVIKPEEYYPKARIAEIEALLAKEKADKNQLYSNQIKSADSAYNSKDWESARLAYVEALSIKPYEGYPKTRLAEVSKIIDELANKEKNQTPVNSSTNDKTYSLNNVFITREKERFAMDLAKKYKQGLTEETEKIGNRTVYKRIIVEGNKGVEFMRVTHDWGGVYYFKNGESISQFAWNKEAIQ